MPALQAGTVHFMHSFPEPQVGAETDLMFRALLHLLVSTQFRTKNRLALFLELLRRHGTQNGSGTLPCR
ncbi:hypothetical protein FJ930_24940 [Mesorhizobium sp. B2-4-15]|nr:hypothetical protein FJ930_24940 [Mesorhizobium sp. B2-4-15]